jgi:short-subunit dehydrogenase
MKERAKKSLIINVSSIVSYAPSPGFCVYGATKAYNDYLSKTLALEKPKNLDIFSLCPGATSTPLTKGMKVDCNTTSSDTLAESTMKFVTCWKSSTVHVKHHIGGWMIRHMPHCMLFPGF